ncbi:MAG: TIM barrel protein [Capsulimonadales bacterium]|nr:TIM barrel protein [Capsulimonadales bacterium]
MRLGGPATGDSSTPEAWIATLRRLNYRAAYCPVGLDADEERIAAYARAAADADIVIAEVGAWSNPISPEEAVRQAALDRCKAALTLAERIGAVCCVNIAGARGETWDGPHPDNLTGETFDRIVDTTREIIDAVEPRRTFYTLEPMPWVFPDSPDSYLRLIAAIDRPQFGVHLDPVNMINCPARCFDNAGFLRECFEKLGPYVKSVHAKDITIAPKLTVHLDEVRPGLGVLDYRVFLTEAAKLGPDMPFLLEHLPTAEEYDLAAAHVRSVAREIGVAL